MARIPFHYRPRHLLWIVPLAFLLIALGLFCVNGLLLARDETPLIEQTSVTPASEIAPLVDATSESPTIKILAYNLAKGFVHEGGVSFADEGDVRARMETIATLITSEQPDLVFLSEAVLECGPCPVNQVEILAEKTGLASWAFGENFNFGVPGYRITSGNAILSRAALTPVGNPSLVGRQPFYMTKNNRRVLFCRTRIAGREVLLGSIHTDSFNLTSNLAQTKQILEFCAKQPTILAGDFNCRPSEPSIPHILSTGQFVGSTESILTFPAHEPDRRLDYIFAPASWELVEERILPGTASDHRAVVATFKVKWE